MTHTEGSADRRASGLPSLPDQPSINAEQVDERHHHVLHHQRIFRSSITDEDPDYGCSAQYDETPADNAWPHPAARISPAPIVPIDAAQRRMSFIALALRRGPK